MSDEKPAAPPPQLGPDDALMGERLQLLLRVDEFDRQLRDMAGARRNIVGQRRTIQGRLDEIAAEFRGRQAVRTAAATKDQ